jgi:hypothetical protein
MYSKVDVLARVIAIMIIRRGDFAARRRLAMEVQGRKDGAAEKTKRTKRGGWTPEQRREIVAASLVAGASINEVAQRFGIRYLTLGAECHEPTEVR